MHARTTQSPQLGDVFVPNRLPTITYNPRSKRKLEAVLRAHVESPQEILLILGPTKSGKTVLTRSVIPDNRRIDIEGTRVLNDESRLWTQATKQLDVATSVIEYEGDEVAGSTGKAGFTINLGFVKLEFGGNSKRKAESRGRATRLGLDPKEETIERIIERESVLVIDDFHSIEPVVQRSIVRALKGPVFEGMRVVLIGIPHREHDVERAMADMGDRIRKLNVPMWDKSELSLIAERGFKALNVTPASNLVSQFSTHAYGSPQLMQRFCSQICLDHRIKKHQSKLIAMRLRTTYEKFFIDFAEHSNNDVKRIVSEYRSPQSGKLVRRKLTKGGERNIYQLILIGIREQLPDIEISAGEIDEQLDKLVVASDMPKMHEITNAARRLSELAAKIAKEEMRGEPVIEWDDKNRLLHIADASFAFHLKWGPL